MVHYPFFLNVLTTFGNFLKNDFLFYFLSVYPN